MNADDVLAVYENLADLTGQMAQAVKAGDWNEFAQLNIEFPINSLITVVSSLNYTKYEFGVIRSAQAGVY